MQAIATSLYVGLVAWFMFNANSFFGKQDSFLAPMALLLLFVLSAAITSSLVLGKSILLYLDNNKKEAIELFAYTLVFLFVIMAATFATIAFVI